MFTLDYPTGLHQKNYTIVYYDYKVILKLKWRKYSILNFLIWKCTPQFSQVDVYYVSKVKSVY